MTDNLFWQFYFFFMIFMIVVYPFTRWETNGWKSLWEITPRDLFLTLVVCVIPIINGVITISIIWDLIFTQKMIYKLRSWYRTPIFNRRKIQEK